MGDFFTELRSFCPKSSRKSQKMTEIHQKSPSPKNIHRGEFNAQVLSQQAFGSEHWSMMLQLTGSRVQCFADSRAGQFINIACRNLYVPNNSSTLLRRPFSIADIQVITNDIEGSYDTNPGDFSEKNHGSTAFVEVPPVKISEPSQSQLTVIVEVIYRLLGKGTHWLAQRQPGDSVNLLGPLGNGFTFPDQDFQPAILVGGGVGIPPMYFLAKQLRQAGHKNIVGFIGCRSKDLIPGILKIDGYKKDEPLRPQMALEQFRRNNVPCVIATDDSSYGFAGNAAQALEQYLDRQSGLEGALIYACGPKLMLRAIAMLAQRRNINCQVCLEAYMACGMGICQSCAVPVHTQQQDGQGSGTDKWHYKLVCTNGPVFNANCIIWE